MPFTSHWISLNHFFHITLAICLLVLLPINFASANDKTDLESIMKQMRFEYNRAMKTDSAKVMTTHLQAFNVQLKKAKDFPHNKQRREKALEGLNKVTQIIDSISLPVTANELEGVRKQLSEIDKIKEQYHDKKVSLWERFYEQLFGANKENETLELIED